jgi:hypothetical protein
VLSGQRTSNFAVTFVISDGRINPEATPITRCADQLTCMICKPLGSPNMEFGHFGKNRHLPRRLAGPIPEETP